MRTTAKAFWVHALQKVMAKFVVNPVKDPDQFFGLLFMFQVIPLRKLEED
jgi:hypothetical protein